MKAARVSSLLVLGEASPLFLGLGTLMVMVSLFVSSYYFYPDPPRYAWKLIVISQALLVALGAMAGQSGLGDLLRLLHARVAPLGALKAARDRLHRFALLFWLLATLPLLIVGGVELQVRPFDTWSEAFDWLTAPPALLALLMLGCATLTASWQGRVSLAFGIGAFLLLGLIVAMGWGTLSEAWVAAGWPVHTASVLLLWPGLQWLLRANVKHRIGAHRPTAVGWRKAVGVWQRYWQFIDPHGWAGLGVAVWALPQQLAVRDERLGLPYLIHLLLLVLFAGMLLQSRDLHWRRLLAPGGAQRSNLGLRILMHSFPGLLLVLLVGSLASVPIALGLGLWNGRASVLDLDLLSLNPATAIGMACDLLLATVIAATLRGFTHSPRISTACVMLTMLIVTVSLAATSPWHAQLNQIRWTRDYEHDLVVLALSLALLPLLRRAWRLTDLHRLARERESEPDSDRPSPWRAMIRR